MGQFGLAKIGGEARCGPSSKHAYLAHRAHAVTERKWGGGKFSAGGSLAMGAGKGVHDPARSNACKGVPGLDPARRTGWHPGQAFPHCGSLQMYTMGIALARDSMSASENDIHLRGVERRAN